MAEIILEPTAQSKVIPLSLRLNDTDTSLVSQLVTNRQFNTADTDAWFSFTLEGLAATTGTFDLTLINLQDKSVFNHTDKMFNTNPFYYKLDSGTDELTNEIRHAGKWVGQLVVTLANGDSATRKFIFDIEGHVLDGAVAQTVLLEDYNALISDIESAKDELTQYNIDYSTLISTVESQEAARVQAELTREQTFNALVDSEIIAQNVATELQNVEATYAPRLLSAEQQLADIEIVADTAAQKADAMASGSPKGIYATLALLQAAYPTGATGAYLVSADGKWYYWNGSIWTPGGTYQSTGIADKAVTPDMLTDVKLGVTTASNYVHLTDAIEAKLRGITFAAITGTPASVKIYACKKNLANILYQSATQHTAAATMVQIELSVLKNGKTYTVSFDTENTGYTAWLKWLGGQVAFKMDGTHKTITFTNTANWTSNSPFIMVNAISAGNCGAITNLMLVEDVAEATYEAYQGTNITVTGTTLAELNSAVTALYATLKTYLGNSTIWCQDATTTISVSYVKSINSILPVAYDDTSIQDFIRNRFKGKKWVSYGDSLTEAGNNLANGSYQYYVHNYFEFGAHVGCGVGGSQVCYNSSAAYNMYVNPDGTWTGKSAMAGNPQPVGSTAINSCMSNWERIDTQIPSDADLVFVFGGANDGSSGFAAWHANPATWIIGGGDPAWIASEHYATYGGDYKIGEFKSAIASMIMKIQCKAPNALIVFCTVAKTKGVTGQNYTDIYTNPSSYDEQLIADFTLEITRRMGVPCIDLYGTSGINNTNRATYVTDVIHPNAEGKKLLSRAIVSGLKPILGKYI